jgi:hypothetical protein
MARKKKDKGGGWILLIILLIGLAIISTPIVLIIKSFSSFFPYLKIRKNIKGTYSDFWLSPLEKTNFKIISENLLKAINNIQEAEKIGTEEGLSRNKDGTFSLRGNRGKEIQGFIVSNKMIKNANYSKYIELRSLPQERWSTFKEAYQNFYNFLICTIGWFVSTGVLISITFPDFNTGLKSIIRFPIDLYNFFITLFTQNEFNTQVFLLQCKVLLISAGVSLIIYILISYITRFTVKKVTPYPPEVNLDNLNSY